MSYKCYFNIRLTVMSLRVETLINYKTSSSSQTTSIPAKLSCIKYKMVCYKIPRMHLKQICR